MLTKIFHAIIIFSYVFVLWYDQMYIDFPEFMQPKKADGEIFKGRLNFLTIWNLFLQTAFFTICLLNDFIGTNEVNPKTKPLIRKIRDIILATLAFPSSLIVVVSFWLIYTVDTGLLIPKGFEVFLPTWINHMMHTNVIFFVLIQMYISYHEYPSRVVGVSILTTFILSYLAWIHINYASSGRWPYPILEVLNLPLRSLLFAALFGSALLWFILGEKLNRILWTITLEVRKRRKHN
ncbi:hypothetical protein RI129_000549 [Pyrocoelia pectoralis]|uniref:Androgen-dependent TFPI-regulating protein n=1 Tax=Pyrocoelia pectoralis TaxID=417401 RepID=A0AAN7ZJD9_9COLE